MQMKAKEIYSLSHTAVRWQLNYTIVLISKYSPEVHNLLKTIHSFCEQWSAWISFYPYQAVRVEFIAIVCVLVPGMLLYVQMGLEIPLFRSNS